MDDSTTISSMCSSAAIKCDALAQTERLMGFRDSANTYQEMADDARKNQFWFRRQVPQAQTYSLSRQRRPAGPDTGQAPPPQGSRPGTGRSGADLRRVRMRRFSWALQHEWP